MIEARLAVPAAKNLIVKRGPEQQGFGEEITANGVHRSVDALLRPPFRSNNGRH